MSERSDGTVDEGPGDVGVDRLRAAFEALDIAVAPEVVGDPGTGTGTGTISEADLAAAEAVDADEEGPDAAPRTYALPQLPEGGTLEGVVEALLLVADAPLAIKDFTDLLGGCDWVPVRRALRGLREHYRGRHGGLELVEVAGGWRMVTRALYAEQVERLRTIEREERLSQAQLEALAIIAYRQPVMRSRIDAIRGADSSGVVRALMDKGLVRVTGRADQLGRPFLYGTTAQFLERFGLRT